MLKGDGQVGTELLRAERWLRGIAVGLVASTAAVAMAVGPTQASAATPVLEFAPPGGVFPVGFEAVGGEVTAAMAGIDSVVHCEESEGLGEVTGPRSAEGTYWFYGCETQGGSQAGKKCSSAGAEEVGEIESEEIDANLVFISQANHEVGMVLAPGGEIYMTFNCEGIAVTAYGPFVSPVGPVNQLTSSFTASLISNGSSQAPSSYENDSGGVIPAVPTGSWESGEKHATGVNLAFAVTTFSDTPPDFPDVALEIRARSSADIEAEARQREEAEAAERKRQENEAAAKAAAAKRQQEEAAAAEAKKRAEEEARAKAKEGAKKPLTRAERLQKALKQCRKLDSKEKRANCVRKAKNRYGAQKQGKHKGTHKSARH